MTAKPELRKHAHAVRATLRIPDFANRIAAFSDALDLPPHAIVAGYWPIRDEADPRALMAALAARGHVLALPRIEARGSGLSFRRWRDGDALIDNPHGIAEPQADAQIIIPDALLVPLLAFDAAGHRLGYGGGYYDRTLAVPRANGAVLVIAVAYAGQETALLPREAHDHGLDMVVTEKGVRKFASS
jgi:5-formyltetrahydrofolate cyclo-ligase